MDEAVKGIVVRTMNSNSNCARRVLLCLEFTGMGSPRISGSTIHKIKPDQMKSVSKNTNAMNALVVSKLKGHESIKYLMRGETGSDYMSAQFSPLVSRSANIN